MHGSLLVEVPGGPWMPERRYAVDVVLGEFLGLDYRLAVGDGPEVRISREDATDARALVLADRLFQTPPADWLTPKSLPARPLSWWCAPHWLTEGHEMSTWLPVLFAQGVGDGYFADEGDTLRLGLDVFGTAFFMLTRYEELARPVTDAYGRFPGSASLAHQEGFLERPIVNEYVEMLWKALKRLWPGLVRKRRSYRLMLSHDVDLPYFTCPKQLLRVGFEDVALRRDPRLALGRLGAFWDAHRGRVEADPFNTFDLLMTHAENAGVRAAFYFIADHTGWLVDGNYRLADAPIRALMTDIHSRGHELGLHPSYHTYRDRHQLGREYRALREALSDAGIHQEAHGGRQHYLRWENPVTWRHWEAIGLDYDATLAYADRVGFRCGTCYEFPVFDLVERRRLKLMEMPLMVMDITLTAYMRLTLPQAVEKLLGISRLCRMFHGNFSLLWHNSSLLLPEQKHWYGVALDELTRSAAWMGGHKAS